MSGCVGTQFGRGPGFEIMTVRESSPMHPDVSAISEYRLDPVEGGTRLTKTSARSAGPLLGRILLRLLTPVFIPLVKRAFETFKLQIGSDYRAHKILTMTTENQMVTPATR